MRRIAPVLLGVLLLGPCRGSAQVVAPLPVVEVGANLFQNTITAAQSVITVAKQVLELEKLSGGIVTAGSMAEDMAAIAAIIQDAQGLQQDVTALSLMFDRTAKPTTLTGMRQRVRMLDSAVSGSRHYALRTQILVSRLVSTTQHLRGLVNGISRFTGNMAANQTLAQVNASINKTLLVQTTQAAAAQRVETLTVMREQAIIAMDHEITRQYWAPYGIDLPQD